MSDGRRGRWRRRRKEVMVWSKNWACDRNRVGVWLSVYSVPGNEDWIVEGASMLSSSSRHSKIPHSAVLFFTCVGRDCSLTYYSTLLA